MDDLSCESVYTRWRLCEIYPMLLDQSWQSIDWICIYQRSLLKVLCLSISMEVCVKGCLINSISSTRQHAGAWKTGDKSEFTWLGERFAQNGFSTAIVNYRLSDKETEGKEDHVQHPAHTQDVASAITYLSHSSEIRNHLVFEPRLYLLGHSAGAQLTGSIVMNPKRVEPPVYNSIKGIVGIEGIYDIPYMDQIWPKYKDWFIFNAFGEDLETWKEASPQYQIPGLELAPYLILHSAKDELLDLPQSLRFAEYLRNTIGSLNVQVDTTSLTDSHDEVLKQDALYNVIAKFVIEIEQTLK